MPSPGTITIRLRFDEAEGAEQFGSVAGWGTSRSSGAPDDDGVIEFSRYVGVSSPDGEVQAAHFQHLENALAGHGFGFERLGNGIVMSGQVNPVAAAGLVYRGAQLSPDSAAPSSSAGGIDLSFAGTCFAFRHTNVFVTAAHCVAGATPGGVFVAPPFSFDPYPVVHAVVHPDADLAILQLHEDAWPAAVEPYSAVAARPWLAAELIAYGFPEDQAGPEDEETSPIPRAFRGHVQRTLGYRRSRYRYEAAEISIPSPAGLSGGAWVSPDDFNKVVAVATENTSSTTYVGSTEETDGHGTVVRIERDRVQYGIAVLLEPLAEWLDGYVPPRVRFP